MGNNPVRYSARKTRRRVKCYPPSPLAETLRIVERRISMKIENAKSVKAFREYLIEICDDAELWKQVEQLRKSVESLKTSIEELGLY